MGSLWYNGNVSADADALAREAYQHFDRARTGDADAREIVIDHIDLSGTAAALHHAVRRLRRRHPHRPIAWRRSSTSDLSRRRSRCVGGRPD